MKKAIWSTKRGRATLATVAASSLVIGGFVATQMDSNGRGQTEAGAQPGEIDTAAALGLPKRRAEVEPSDPLTAELQLTNAVRSDRGCRPLRVDKGLQRAAGAHARDMSERNYMEHDTQGGQSWYKRVWKYAPGFGHIGENIASGFNDAESVHNAWIRSPEHRANILDCSFRFIGIGYAGGYWVQDFGAK